MLQKESVNEHWDKVNSRFNNIMNQFFLTWISFCNTRCDDPPLIL